MNSTLQPDTADPHVATRDEVPAAREPQLLGTSIFANVSSESGTIRFTSLKDKFEPAMALLADMLLNSTFPDSALEPCAPESRRAPKPGARSS